MIERRARLLATTALAVFAVTTASAAQQAPGGPSNTAGTTGAADAQDTQRGTPAGAAPVGSSPGGAPAAAAAAGPAVEEDAIIVTGFRESLRSSRNLKRNAPQIVDAIVAEDIGKLPDLAISDTAARIPGVQVTRLGGEASQITVRGLGEDFFNTLYNGREIFTAERRSVALQDFPSAAVAALEVFKTSTANLVEPGVAGQTNVRSRRAFDIKGFEIAGNAWGIHTVQAGALRPNGNILISKRFDTGIGEIGVLVNASYTDLTYLDSEPSNTDFLATPNINGQTVRFPDIQRVFYRAGNRTRPSGNFSVQWRPNNSKFEFYVDGLYQGFRNKVSDRVAAVPLFGGQSYSNLEFRPGSNLVRSGTVTNPGAAIFSFQGATFNKTDTYQYAVGGSYKDGPLTITADVARTDTTFTGSTESVDREFGVGGYTVNFNTDVPQFTVTGFDVSDPRQYRFTGLYEENQRAHGDDIQARIDAEYKFDGRLLRSLQLGVRYTTRDADRFFGNRFGGFGGRNIPITAIPVNFEPIRAGFRNTDIQPNFQQWFAPTYDSVRNNIVAFRQFVIANNPGGFGTFTTAPPVANPESIFNAHEETIAGYGQLNFNIGDRIDGIVGVRAVNTDTTVRGNALLAGVVTPIGRGSSNLDFLPNASLRFKIAQPLQLRLSFSQTITRPTFSQLNPSVNVGSPDPRQGGLRFGGGGNPDLQSYRSNNYDASLEYYFSRTGFASAAYFHRDIENFIQTQTVRFTDPLLGPLQIDRPVNTSQTTRIDGAEAQINTFFDFAGLPEFLKSFGVQANYTYLDTSTFLAIPGTANFLQTRILGVSRHTFNLTGLFEKGPVSARVSYNRRTGFQDQVQFRGNDTYLQRGLPPGRVDLSVNLRASKNFTLFFDATNISGEPFKYRFSSARDGLPREEFVRFLRFDEQTFSAGLRFRFGPNAR